MTVRRQRTEFAGFYAAQLPNLSPLKNRVARPKKTRGSGRFPPALAGPGLSCPAFGALHSRFRIPTHSFLILERLHGQPHRKNASLIDAWAGGFDLAAMLSNDAVRDR